MQLPVLTILLGLIATSASTQYTSPSPNPVAGTAGPNIAQAASSSVNGAYSPNTSNILPAWNGFIQAYGTKLADASCKLFPVNGPNT